MGKKISNKTAKKMVEKKVNFKPIIFSIIAVLSVIILAIGIITNSKKEETYVTVGNTELTETEYSFYYTLTVNNYLYQYDGYLDYIGLDKDKPYSEQYIDETTTWQDFFIEMTNSLIQTSFTLYDDAKKNDYPYKNNSFYIDFVSNIKNSASENKSTYNNYVKNIFGENMTVKIFEKQLEIYSTSIMYSNYLNEEYEKNVTDEEIKESYFSNKDNYDKVEYYLFAVPYSKEATEDNYDEEILTKETAIKIAEKVNNASSVEDFNNLCYENCLESYKDVYSIKDRETLFVYSKNELIKSLQDWMYSDERIKGDTLLVDDESSSNIIVVCFITKYLDLNKTVDFRYITLTLESYETEENLKKQAEGMYNLWISEGATEDEFIKYANLYSENEAENGLCEGVYKGKVDITAENWLFDENRKNGDHCILKINDDYHLFYYIGTNEPYYCNIIRDEIGSNVYETYIHDILGNYKLVFSDGTIYDTMSTHSNVEENTEK